MAPAPTATPRVIEPADDLAVLWEQFALMLDHVADAPSGCSCFQCARYLAVRAILFQIFQS